MGDTQSSEKGARQLDGRQRLQDVIQIHPRIGPRFVDRIGHHQMANEDTAPGQSVLADHQRADLLEQSRHVSRAAEA